MILAQWLTSFSHKRNEDKFLVILQFVVVHSLIWVWLFTIWWTTACQASLSFTIFQSIFKLMSVKSVMPYNCLILCHPLLFLPSIFMRIRVFSNELALCIKWPKYYSFFSFSISPSNEYSELISFRIDWFDPLAVRGTLQSLLQYHSSKASILWCPAFFMVLLSHLYMTMRNTIALTMSASVYKWVFFTTLKWQTH